MRSFRCFIFAIIFLLATAACAQPTPIPTPLPAVTSTTVPTVTPTPPSVQSIQTATAAQPVEQATVRIINAAPDTPPLNVFVGFKTIATNLGFGQFTEATKVDAESYEVKVTQSGSRPNDPSLLETDLDVKGGQSSLLLLTKSNNTLALTALPAIVDPVSGGETIITFINVLATGEQAALRQNNADLTSAVTAGQSATTGILPAGETTLEFTSKGTKLLDYSVDLAERKHYTLILAGTAAAPSVVELSFDAPGRTAVRALNASQALAPVDVYLNDQLLNGNISFGRPSDRQNRIAGDYTAIVYPAGADRSKETPLVSQKVSLGDDQNISLIIVGVSSDLKIVPFAEDLSATAPGISRIAFVNTLDTIPTVHIETSTGPLEGVPDAVFGEPPTSATLYSSTYTFFLSGVDQNGENQTVENAEKLQFEQGFNYLYVITGQLGQPPTIISDSVEVNQDLADFANTGGEPELLNTPAQVRYINMIADQTPIDIFVDNTSAFTKLEYGQATDLLPVTHKNPRFSINVNGDTTSLNSLTTTLDELGRYTIIIYGRDRTTADLQMVTDTDLVFDATSPHLRMINVSTQGGTALGLGVAEARFVPADTNASRQPVPAGTQRTIDKITDGEVSPVILVTTGTKNLFVIDANTDELAASILNTELKAGAHYDVVTYEDDTQQVQALLFEYPAH